LCAWASQESGAAGSRAILLLLDPPAKGDAHALVAAVERHLPGTVVAAYRAADPSTIRAVRSSDLIGDEGHARDDEEPQPLTPVVVPRSAEELDPMMSRRASMTSATGPVLRLTPPLDDDPDETVRTSAASSADQLTREELAMLLDSDPAAILNRMPLRTIARRRRGHDADTEHITVASRTEVDVSWSS
jgi:hypothetical protein